MIHDPGELRRVLADPDACTSFMESCRAGPFKVMAQFMLNPALDAVVDVLAAEWGLSRAAVIRELIINGARKLADEARKGK